jgi:LemA protein
MKTSVKSIKKIWVLLLLIAPMVLSSCGYNQLVNLDEASTSQWAQVENAYQRRADLIPNLVNTVKGSASFEQSTLTGVIEARAKATAVTIKPENLDAASLQQFQSAQDGLSSALSRLMMVVESYPDLKTTQQFSDLMVQLEGTENRITVERNKFNEAVMSYNTKRRSFPTIIYAGWFGFKEKPYFKATEKAQEAPEVKF